MRLLSMSLVLAAGCGFQVGAGVPGGGDDVLPDAPPDTPHVVPPRVIAGGGVGDAPIDGTVNVYAIDWVTGGPIAGAMVDVGDQSGTTDATGLFVASAASLQGKQTVVATATDYRAEEWIGVGGANVTLAMHALNATVGHVDVMGTFDMFNAGLPQLMPMHVRGGVVGYSQAEGVADPYNNIRTANGANNCRGGMCSFTVSTRTGHVALLGTTYDIDTKNTSDPGDDTRTFQTYSYKTGLVLTQTGAVPSVALTQVPPGMLVDLALDRGTLPPGTTGFFAVAGIELPDDGALYLSEVLTTQTATVKSPPLALFPNAQYRIAGLAGHAGTLSIVVRRGLGTGLSLNAGAWLVEPSATATRTDATWTPSADTTLAGALVTVTNGADVLNVLAFDGTTAVTWPARVTLPAQMTVYATAQRGALDLTDLSFARDGVKIDGIAHGVPLAVP